MNDQELASKYETHLRPLYDQFSPRLHALLEELIRKEGIPVNQIECRTKTTESLLAKIKNKSYEDPFQQIKDFAGLRIITYYHDDADSIASLVRREFTINEAESIDKADELDVDEFGYRSIHLVANLKEPRASLPEWNQYSDLFFEVQIRSVLQHAWAAISHRVDYKVASQAPPELRRRLFRLGALLELADDEFLALRIHTQEVKKRYRDDLERGALGVPLNRTSLIEYLMQTNVNPWVRLGIGSGMIPIDFEELEDIDKGGALNRLLLTLQALGIGSVYEFAELLPTLRKGAKTRLRSFMRRVKQEKAGFFAIPADILTVLVSLKEADRLPHAFDWGDSFYPQIQAALQKSCQARGRRKRTSSEQRGRRSGS